MTHFGIDVSKDRLQICSQAGAAQGIENQLSSIRDWLKTLPKDAAIAVEATGRYHRDVANEAARKGFRVYVVNPYKFSLYRKSLRPAAKTDRIDANILARYAQKEGDSLQPFKPPTKALQKARDLMQLRKKHVDARVMLAQSLRAFKPSKRASSHALTAIDKDIEAIEREILELVKDDPIYNKLLNADGVGPAIASALTWLFRTHDFGDPEELVSFVGLAPRVCESGIYRGQRKLTKQGPAFIRALLFNGARSASRIKGWDILARWHLANGKDSVEVGVILSRKILRIAWRLAYTDDTYNRTEALKR